MPRDTSTGWVLESMIGPALAKGGYRVTKQKLVGTRPGGRRQIVDALAEKNGKKFLISLKWQQVSGTAEQKVPFEVICLIHAINSNHGDYSKAYLVLGGSGWSLRDFYVTDGLRDYINHKNKVSILTLEDFVAIANKGSL